MRSRIDRLGKAWDRVRSDTGRVHLPCRGIPCQQERDMFYRSSGPAVAMLAWVVMALPAGAQNTATTAKVRFVQPDGRALPASLFVVRDARGIEIAPRPEPYGAFSFSDVGRKVTF